MNSLINIILLRLKLIFRNPAIKLLVAIIVILFITLIGSLYSNIEKNMQLNIGYINEGASNLSKEIILNINNNEFLNSNEITREEGIHGIKNGDIEAFFIIKADIEEKVLNGELNELIDIYYLHENRLSPMIGDVFVAEMLQEISILTAINYLEDAIISQDNKVQILDNAYKYAKELAKDRKEDFYVNIEFITKANDPSINIKNIDNKIIYKQMIFGIVISFISFFILFTATNIVKDKENNIAGRIIITKSSLLSIVLGEYISILFSSSFIALIFALLSAIYSNSFVNTLLLNYVILILYIATFTAIIIVITRFFKNISPFIVIGTSLTVILGIISGCFFNIDLSLPIIKKIASITPSYHALEQLLSLIIYNELNNFGQYVLYTCFVIIFLLILSIGLLRRQEN